MQARLAFRELFLWLADFEKWVQQTKGLYYRRDSLQLWARRAICPGHLMPSAWRGFACEAVRGPAPDVAPITVHNVKQARQISVSIREQNSYAA